MWYFKLAVFVVCSAIVSGNNFSSEFPWDFLKIVTPEDFGRHLENRLAKNETKLLSRQCLQHISEYSKGLISAKMWAWKMFDASAKFPTGLLRGFGGGLGSFDECLSVEGENEKVGTIRGKYCLGIIRLLNFKKDRRYRFEEIDTGFSGPQQKLINLVEASVGIPWGVCLPEACSAKDVQFLHFLFFLRFSERNCQTKASQTKEFDDADIGAIIFLGVIAALMFASTMYDIFSHYTEKGTDFVLLRSFSIITNASKILTSTNKDNEISCLHGIRSLNLLILMLGYRYGLHLFAPLNNWLELATWILNTSSFLEAVILLDTFFVISGTLISYNYLQARTQGLKFNLFTYYLNRIIRLTPALAVVVLIHTTLLRHIGSGPVWLRARDPMLVNNCRKYWWSSLLYVQNYVNPYLTQICVLQSWQLSVEMQLFLLSPLILIPLTRVPKFTLAAVGFLLFCSMLSPFLAVWVYKLKSVIITFRSLEDIVGYAKHFFFPTHTRATAWIIGFILGYVIFETKKIKLEMPIRKELLAVAAIFLWAASLGMIYMCVMFGKELTGVEYNWVTHAFYMALVRPTWAVAISWIIFACVHGYAGPINSILSVPFFQVISKISYSTSLVNFTLMFILTYQTRRGLNFSDFDSIYRAPADIVFCLALGFLWTVAFESPFIIIGKVVFGKLERRGVKVPSIKDEETKIIGVNVVE